MCQGILLPEIALSSCGNALAIWHGFPDITHIKVNNRRNPVILNFDRLTFLGHIRPCNRTFFYCNGLATFFKS